MPPTCTTHLIFLRLITLQYLVKSKYYEAPLYVTFWILLPLPFSSSNALSTIFSNILSACSSFRKRYQLSHPHKVVREWWIWERMGIVMIYFKFLSPQQLSGDEGEGNHKNRLNKRPPGLELNTECAGYESGMWNLVSYRSVWHTFPVKGTGTFVTEKQTSQRTVTKKTWVKEGMRFHSHITYCYKFV
jgi:hypothetical protein